MQRKIFLSFFTVLIVGVLFSGFLTMRIVKDNYYKNVEEKFVSNSYLVRELVFNKIETDGSNNLNDYINSINNIINGRITVIDINGKVIADTDSDFSAGYNFNSEYLDDIMKDKLLVKKDYDRQKNLYFLYTALPIYKQGIITAIIRLSTPLYQINVLTYELYLSIAVSILIGLLVALYLGYRISIKITNPIKEMTYLASKISKGQFEKRIYLNSKDEVGELANSINHMASRLDETINSLKDKNIKMESILSSVVNGIIAVDNFEKILFINPVAISVLNIREKNIIGKHLLQVVRNNELDDFLKSIIKNKTFISTEININYPEEKVLKIYTNPIKYMDNEDVIGIIITIQDITELRRLERMRTEFVANVSHELKTPLTSIKGFAETLKNGAIDDRSAAQRFLSIIEVEADRLFRLINDILSLSELENKKTKLNIEYINIDELVSQVISIMASQAQKKNISIKKQIDISCEYILGDQDELKQMFINLIDNAVKYTPENGEVRIEAYNCDNKLIINIIDNGIGIPKEHIPRLFERFYRVDKARSKKIGGTGLGLAIVKHIVKSYNGEISVESKVGEGTKFTIVLPIR